MPRTWLAFLVGSLALVGLPPFSGFFSKDSILAASMHAGWFGYLLWVAGMAGAFLTALYTFRMVFVVFGGQPSAFVREHLVRPRGAAPHGAHAHSGEGPFSMTAPVAILAVLALVGGWIQFAPLWTPLTSWLHTVAPTLPRAEPTSWQEAVSSALAVALGVAGIVAAWLVYARRALPVPRLAFAQRLLEHKLYFDEAYDLAFYRPAASVARLLRRGVEDPVVGGSVAGIAESARLAGSRTARIQTGLIRTYALAIAASLAVLAVVFISVR